MLEGLFRLSDYRSDVRTEVLAGCTTFLAMSYILFVNPQILGSAGMDPRAVFIATCLAAAVGSLAMALLANYPVATAPGMGLNAFFAFNVVAMAGYSWQAALGLVFISGCLFFVLSLSGARGWLVAGIPESLRCGITAGIGLFLAIIALQKAGVVVADAHTMVTLGDLHRSEPLLALGGFALIAVLEARRVRGAILIGMLAVTLAAAGLGKLSYHGIVALPRGLGATWLQLDLGGALRGPHGHEGGLAALLHVLLVFVLVEVFDATGTLLGVARRAGLLAGAADRRRFSRALLADSTAILAGAVLGTSSTTAYVESAAGVQAGGRTGLTAAVVALLFLAALLFSPLASMVPAYATAPALLYVATSMLRDLAAAQWDDLTEAVPAALCALAMPLTYSIANGLALGFLCYVVLKIGTGRGREVHLASWLIALLFVLRFALD